MKSRPDFTKIVKAPDGAQPRGEALQGSLSDAYASISLPHILPPPSSAPSLERRIAAGTESEYSSCYSHASISDVSKCLKLATKLIAGRGLCTGRWDEEHRSWYNLFKSSVGRGIQLIANEAPVKHVLAGMLPAPTSYDHAYCEIKEDRSTAQSAQRQSRINSIIVNKFGYDVLNSIEHHSFLAFCHCEIEHEEASVVSQAQKAFLTAFDLYEGIDRQWGPKQNLPLIHHASEVGLLLLAARYPATTVAAGFLHDAFENYCAIPHSEIVDIIHARLANSFTYGEIQTVIRKIKDNTETVKSAAPNNWEERKGTVFKALHYADADTTAVCCASKISTLANANKWNYLEQPLSAWSKGTFQQNLEHFRTLGRLFEEKGVRAELRDVFNEQLQRFSAWRNRQES